MRPLNQIQYTFRIILRILCLAVLILSSSQVMVARADGEVDLQVGLKAPLHVASPGALVFNLSFSNKGTLASPEQTSVTVTLADDLTFAGAVNQYGDFDPPTAINGQELTWLVGAVPADSTWDHIWISTTVGADLPEGTVLTSTAEIYSDAPESNTENNMVSISSVICDMAGSKKQANTQYAKPGDVVTYTITLSLTQRNQMQHRVRTVTLTDQLPPATQARFMGWVGEPPGQYQYNQEQHQLQWQGEVGDNAPVMFQYQLGIEGDVPPGAQVTNRAHIHWSGGGDSGNMDLEPVVVQTYLTGDDHIFGQGGGQWQHAWGLTLDVPPNAVQEMTRFQFQARTGTPPDAPPGWMYANRYFELNAFQFGQEIHEFDAPLQLTVRYSRGDTVGIGLNSLRLWYRAGPGEPWAMLGEPQQNRNGQITVSTGHFTEFALFGQAGYELMMPLIRR